MDDIFEGFGPLLMAARDRAHDPSRVVDINKFRRRQDLLQLQQQNPEKMRNAIYDYEEDKILNDNDIEYDPQAPYPMPVENRYS